MEALVLVTKTAELRGVLERFYGALGLPYRPESVGDLPRADVPGAIEVLSEAVRERYGAREVKIGEDMLKRALALRESWRAASSLSGGLSNL